MPRNNRFRHQAYDLEPPQARFELLAPAPPPLPASAAFETRMRRVGETLRRAGVKAIYLLHGTFAGTDALSLFREISRLWPAVADQLSRLEKQLVDAVTGDAGNYTPEFATLFFESLLRPNRSGEIPVRLFHWTGENHHVGRADGAVWLLDALAALAGDTHGRVLLWGHSHGGNVLALVTNLLAADRSTRRRFFHAARSCYRRIFSGRVDLPVWERVRALFDCDGNPLESLSLDVVTFGSPIRYGWDTGGCAGLVHFVNHRPREGAPPHRAVIPRSIDGVLHAENGDLIQQLGIAGTNFAPTPLILRTWLADRRLNRLLQTDVRPRRFRARLEAGARVHQDGTTLLVDYGPSVGHLGQHLAGHGVYTRPEWLVFHAEEAARRLYPAERPGSSLTA